MGRSTRLLLSLVLTLMLYRHIIFIIWRLPELIIILIIIYILMEKIFPSKKQ